MVFMMWIQFYFISSILASCTFFTMRLPPSAERNALHNNLEMGQYLWNWVSLSKLMQEAPRTFLSYGAMLKPPQDNTSNIHAQVSTVLTVASWHNSTKPLQHFHYLLTRLTRYTWVFSDMPTHNVCLQHCNFQRITETCFMCCFTTIFALCHVQWNCLPQGQQDSWIG